MRSLYILVMLIMTGCYNPNWKLLNGKGLLSMYQDFSKVLIIDKNTALMFGLDERGISWNDSKKGSDFPHPYPAIICRTEDGGNSWTTQYFGKGGFWGVFVIDDIIYATLEIGHGLFQQKTTRLLKSVDFGKSWVEIKEFPINISIVYLDKKMNGIITSYSKKKRKNIFYISKDGLNTLKEIPPFYGVFYGEENKFVSILGEKINGNYISNKISIYDVNKEIFKYEVVQKDLDIIKIYKEEKFWILGKRNGNTCIYCRIEENNYKLIYCFDFKDNNIFAKDIFVAGDKIIIVIGKMYSLSVKNSILYSEDGGKTWVKENIPSPLVFIDYDFKYNKETDEIMIMASAAGGDVQTRCMGENYTK